MSLPISHIIKELETTPKSVIPILSGLHKECISLHQVSKVDLKHLVNRTLNLCKSNQPYATWCGVNIVWVLVENAELLSQNGNAFFSQLMKLLQTSQPGSKLFSSTVDCLNKLCQKIRGKPTLTREILTPNLSGLLTAYTENLTRAPALMSTSLQILVLHHPTTSRPHANKIRAKLLDIIADESFLNYPNASKKSILSLLATLPVVEKDGPEAYWLKDVHRILLNIGGTVRIFDSFLDLKEDSDVSKLLQAFSGDEEEIFGSLHIDVNRPQTLLSILTRIELLLSLLNAYVTTATQYAIAVPIGKILGVVELICSVNTKFVNFRREIRDHNIRDLIKATLLKSQHASVLLLRDLPLKYAGALMPHLTSIFSTLELIIPLNGKRLDHANILKEEHFVCDILDTVSTYVGLVSHYQDHALFIRFIEAAIFLVEPRSDIAPVPKVNENKQPQHSKAARKRAKKNGATPLADLLSHEHLFASSVPQSTKDTSFRFFTTVIPRVSIAPTQYNKLIKVVVVEAVKYKDRAINDNVPEAFKNILLAIVLNPAPEAAAILPIASTLLRDSELLSVLNNPRFPILPKIVSSTEVELDDDEEDENEVEVDAVQSGSIAEDIKSEKPSQKKRKLNTDLNSEGGAELNSSETPHAQALNLFTENSAKQVFEEVEAKPISQTVSEDPQPEPVGETIEEVSEDEGSEIEIPDLDLDEDSDDDN